MDVLCSCGAKLVCTGALQCSVWSSVGFCVRFPDIPQIHHTRLPHAVTSPFALAWFGKAIYKLLALFRIGEYSVLEGNHKDQIQLLSLHRTL